MRNIFLGIKSRCYNQNDHSYKFYGAKGIRVCEEWLSDPSSFERWALSCGYTDGLTIDRMKEKSDYSPDNCRWVTNNDNAKYKSTTNLIEVNGEVHTGHDWASICGIGTNVINTYLRTYDGRIVQDFIAHTIENGLVTRSKSNQSYIDAYLSTVNDGIKTTYECADVIQSVEYLTSNQEAAGS